MQPSIFPVAFLLAVLVSGCSSGLDAIYQTAKRSVVADSNVSGAKLDPRFRYIRATVKGRPAFLALGNEEPGAEGVVRVWYSANKEVLKFRDGRLVGASGLNHEWRNVFFNDVPSWAQLLKSDSEKIYTRYRDVMPGYRLGVEDRLSIRRIAQPKRAVRGISSEGLVWFEERQVGGAADMTVPRAIYGLEVKNGVAEVVYGEQCIAKDLCFTWQKWAVTP